MSPVVIPLPTWAAGAAGLPAGGMERVLGSRAGSPHVVAVRRSLPDGVTVVAKHYADGTGQQAATVMRALHDTMDRAAPLAVPVVHAWDSTRRVLVQAVAEGLPLLPMLRSGERAVAVRAAARALACLHAQTVSCGPRASMADHLRDLVRPHPEEVADALGHLGTRVRAVVDTLRATERTASAVGPVPLHRDAHARQMLFDGARVWLVDWDLFARGDPALDVANFSVYLRTHLADGAQDAAARFVEAYADIGPDVSGRLALYRAFTYVRLLCKAYRLKRPGWRRRVDEYLACAEAHAAH